MPFRYGMCRSAQDAWRPSGSTAGPVGFEFIDLPTPLVETGTESVALGSLTARP